MNSLKDVFTIKQPQEVASEKMRDHLLANKRRFDLLSGATVISIGFAIVLKNLLDIHVSEGVSLVLGGAMFIILMVTLIGSARLSKYNLNPKDEYEDSRQIQGRAAAYSFLVPSLLLIFFLTTKIDDLSWGGAILIVLGISRFVEHNKLTKK